MVLHQPYTSTNNSDIIAENISASISSGSPYFDSDCCTDFRLKAGLQAAISAPLRDRYRENTAAADLGSYLLETGFAHQFVELELRATTHDPGIAVAISQHAGDHLDLRMPGLGGINEIPSIVDSLRKATKTLLDRSIIRE